MQEQNNNNCKMFRIKTENNFLHNSIKNSGNFDIKHLPWSKTDLSKETKKMF